MSENTSMSIEESEALAQLQYESRVADLFRESGEEQCSSPEVERCDISEYNRLIRAAFNKEEERLEGGYYEPGDEDIDGWE